MKSIVLSGGGSMGSFEAGVIYAIYDKYRFDQICGTSAGALNSILLAQAYINNDKEIIKRIWTEEIKKSSTIYSANYLKALINSAPYSYNPLRKLINQNIDFEKIIQMNETIKINAVDLVTGNLEIFSNKDEGMIPRRMLEATIASCSIPPAFPPVEIDDMKLIDGGTRENIPVYDLIENKKNDYTLIVISFRPDIVPANKKSYGMIDSGLRAVNIMINEVSLGDLNLLEELNMIKKLDNNYKISNFDIIQPNEDPCPSVLDFDQATLQKGFEIGEIYGYNFLSKCN